MLIELQFTPEIDYLHRMLYGTSKTITERMVQGSEYLEVKKIYSINIVYFDLGHGKDYIYRGKTNFIGLHENDELYLSKPQRDAFNKETASDIYPEYFVLKVNNFNDTMKDRFDEWVYFLKHNVIKDEFKAKGLVKARKILDRDLLTPEEQRAYDDAWWQRSEDLSAVASSKLEGRIEGREEGREEGKIEREKLMEELEALMKKLENERQERENERKEREKERQERENERKEREKEQVELKKLARNYEILLAEIARLKRKKQK
ncbi:MAG: Rpn family recombination-promoting nuclease/putative transposase [Planctomycetaceae bacterium]|jgi:hypothetical protein|nr:Rpn family recombination-promoting nuclease/putative transposase [Planctomycetaceae bacterium]